MHKYLIFFLSLLRPAYACAQDVTERFEHLSGRLVYIARKGEKPATPAAVLLALHGSGRSADSYATSSTRGVPFYVHQRDLA